MYAGLAPYEALAIYAVITYMDTVNGVFVPEGGMHALPVALATAAEKAGATFRYGTRVDRILLADGTSGPVTGVRLADGEVVAGRRRRSPTPTYPSPTARSCPARRCRRGRASRATTRRRPSSGTSASAASCRPGTEHHNIHFGRDWDGAFRAILRDGVRMPDPVAPRQRPIPARADDGARAARHALVRPRAHPEPRRPRRLDRASEAAPVTTSTATSIGSATRPPSRSRSSSTRSTGRRRGWSGAPRSPSRTGSSRPVRSGRATSSGGRPAWCSPAPAPCPGVGVPMVLVSGVLAAQRVQAMEVR